MRSERRDSAMTAGFVPDCEINNSAHDLIVQTALQTHCRHCKIDLVNDFKRKKKWLYRLMVQVLYTPQKYMGITFELKWYDKKSKCKNLIKQIKKYIFYGMHG